MDFIFDLQRFATTIDWNSRGERSYYYPYAGATPEELNLNSESFVTEKPTGGRYLYIALNNTDRNYIYNHI